MKRRLTTRGKASKARRRKTASPRRGVAAAVARRASDSDLKAQLDQRTSELSESRKLLSESLEQQTATAEILRVISRSLDTQPVFNAIVQAGLALFPGSAISIELPKDGEITAVAIAAENATGVENWRKIFPFPLTREYMAGVAILDRRIVDVADAREGSNDISTGRQNFLKSGYRAVTKVPMLRGDSAIGVLSVARPARGALSDKQLAILKTFADQAVIAIENARLLGELRQRTGDLSEALEQQTATSEVLKVISSSPGDLKPVFQTILENATRLCEAKFGILWLSEGDGFRSVALHDVPRVYAEERACNPVIYPSLDTGLGRAALAKQAIHIEDIKAEPSYRAGDPVRVASVDLAGARTLLVVPMLKDNDAVGMIAIFRQEVCPFSDKQIELVQNFAAQAVIAIENARLLNELRESLQQQTATADVLKVISRSAYDLHTVLDSLLRTAGRLCDADMGTITQKKGDRFYRAVSFGFPPEYIEYIKDRPVEPSRNTGTGRALVEREIIHIPDVHSDPEFNWPEAQRLGGFRTMLGVPMLREGVPVGVMALTRSEVRPFSDKEIELVSTFADQAAIAIENVRLFDEIQDKGRQLAEASQHKSQFLASMSHELRTPLNAILGYTELIADGVYGAAPDKMQAVLKRVESNGKHLLGLINAVLDLSKIEAGHFTLDLGDYSMGDVTQTVFSAVEALAIDKKLAFKAKVAPDLPRGYGDERRLAQVLLNLAGNAIKFTDAGEVVIVADANKGLFSVSVRDTGPGISAADQAHLFQEFQQADNSLTRKKGGTGLGLAISKCIIEMHGGRIWIESQLGQGSTFFVTLPVQAQEQTKPPLKQD
jgi:signal transduction histidine kinase